MSDIATLEQEIGSAIAAAGDEAALETVRVAALGKSGSVSALLKTLGGMTPARSLRVTFSQVSASLYG